MARSQQPLVPRDGGTLRIAYSGNAVTFDPAQALTTTGCSSRARSSTGSTCSMACFAGFLNGTTGGHVRREHVYAALDPLFAGTVEVTEEAIINARCAATTTGRDGNTFYALPVERLPALMHQYGR